MDLFTRALAVARPLADWLATPIPAYWLLLALPAPFLVEAFTAAVAGAFGSGPRTGGEATGDGADPGRFANSGCNPSRTASRSPRMPASRAGRAARGISLPKGQADRQGIRVTQLLVWAA